MRKNISNLFHLTYIFLSVINVQAFAVDKEIPEKFISQILERKVPYQKSLLNCSFTINNINVYAPDRLQEMFATYLINENLITDKIVADIGSACGSMGIMLAKNGAKQVLITSLYKDVAKCAMDNAKLNQVDKNTYIYFDKGVRPLLPTYENKVDIVVTGIPWDSITSLEFDKISLERQIISQAFYDLDDRVIKEILLYGWDLLKPNGKIYITSSKKTLDRIHQLCTHFKVKYKIVRSEDFHNDGNENYIVELQKHK